MFSLFTRRHIVAAASLLGASQNCGNLIHADSSKPSIRRLEADLMIPGRGPPVKNGVVVISGKSIQYAGPKSSAPPLVAGEIVAKVPVIMPGMWDCHVHFLGLPNKPKGDMMDSFLKVPVEERAARIVGHGRKALEAGFTSVRDVGGMGGYLKVLVDGGEVPGPNIYSAYDVLSMSGGHGDLHQFPCECLHVCTGKIGYLCDGEAECLKAVRMQLRKGAEVIKVCYMMQLPLVQLILLVV